MEPPFTLTAKQWPPNYTKIFAWRQDMVLKVKKNPSLMYGAFCYYREHPVEFINHWVDTFDPRNAMIELPTRLPFNMFERQEVMVKFLHSCLLDEANGLVDKSRDMGATWVASGFSVWLWLFRRGASVGWGSRKEILVDKLGDPDSIFEKMRMVVRGLPLFFWPKGFDPDAHMTYMRFVNPENEATITGEAGDNIGRGGRKLIYFKDESAHYEHPESIEASLGDNTRVQIDISTHNGVASVFNRKLLAGHEWVPGRKTEKGATRVFVLDWSHHPTKTKEWHELREKQARDAGLLHIFRQEVDRDAAASLQGVIIQAEWIRYAVDAHLELGFGDDGGWGGGLDPADEGGDLHAGCFRKGVVLKWCDDWGQGDVGEATRHIITETVGRRPMNIQYDAVGVGAGVKAEVNRLVKTKEMPHNLSFLPWLAGLPALRPEERVIPGDNQSPRNKDFYSNIKAQAWWALRRRFEKVYRMRTEKGVKFPSSELISIDSRIPKLQQLMRELSQPVMIKDGKLRLKVDKKPEGARSPNLGDATVMNYFPVKVPLVITPEVIAGTRGRSLADMFRRRR